MNAGHGMKLQLAVDNLRANGKTVPPHVNLDDYEHCPMHWAFFAKLGVPDGRVSKDEVLTELEKTESSIIDTLIQTRKPHKAQKYWNARQVVEEAYEKQGISLKEVLPLRNFLTFKKDKHTGKQVLAVVDMSYQKVLDTYVKKLTRQADEQSPIIGNMHTLQETLNIDPPAPEQPKVTPPQSVKEDSEILSIIDSLKESNRNATFKKTSPDGSVVEIQFSN